jgi:hypothetical protein
MTGIAGRERNLTNKRKHGKTLTDAQNKRSREYIMKHVLPGAALFHEIGEDDINVLLDRD